MKKDFIKDERKLEVDLPEGYLNKGFFNTNGNLLEKYITTWAEEIAQKLGRGFPDMKRHQLRRFYNHVKSLERKLDLTGDYDSINKDLKMLIPYAVNASSANPPKVPKLFEEFIRKNLGVVEDLKTFCAFLDHFQAIVGFSERYLKKN